MQQDKINYKDNQIKGKIMEIYINITKSTDNTKLKQILQKKWKEIMRERNLKIVFHITGHN